MHGQPGYIRYLDVPIQYVVTWQEHHSGVVGNIQVQLQLHTQGVWHNGLNCEDRMHKKWQRV